ncbi:hypothetical protein M1P56_17890 [Streptomyces sp. HU2014]|uniref:hypothetical protein n=1 Tax=Streptomyces sp. HU2014 TaxID=2939414 RepID=UPI00200DFE3E|nr:hypothetical protein [Streptomyces sp. HU2014]UQI45965.1 hypothetical protein M1P56_17210 [Streptomyces sp. HU2014]UQI46083.1 hypothetical protein M1P56_17890 [Streptomyces sp. HU2014]
MDSTALARAYRSLLDAAQALTAAVPVLGAEDRATADWTLGHIALSDGMLAAVARDVLAGRPARIDNTAAMEPAALARLTAATSHAGRVALVRRHAGELLGLVEALSPHQAAALVQARLVDRTGRQVFDGRLAWEEVVRMRAEEHLPGHAATLAALHPAAGRA